MAVKFGMIDAGALLGSSEMFKQQNTRLRDCALILLGNQVNYSRQIQSLHYLNQHHIIVFFPLLLHISSGLNQIFNKIIPYLQNLNSRPHIKLKHYVI